MQERRIGAQREDVAGSAAEGTDRRLAQVGPSLRLRPGTAVPAVDVADVRPRVDVVVSGTPQRRHVGRESVGVRRRQCRHRPLRRTADRSVLGAVCRSLPGDLGRRAYAAVGAGDPQRTRRRRPQRTQRVVAGQHLDRHLTVLACVLQLEHVAGGAGIVPLLGIDAQEIHRAANLHGLQDLGDVVIRVAHQLPLARSAGHSPSTAPGYRALILRRLHGLRNNRVHRQRTIDLHVGVGTARRRGEE